MLPRLKDYYENKIVNEIRKEFSLKNKLMVPKIDKVILNMGLGQNASDKKILQNCIEDISLISGQKPIITRFKKSISNFKTRKGTPAGVKVTLRKNKMYEFVDRLVNIALPRIKDFQGLNPNGFDDFGNFTFGIKEHRISDNIGCVIIPSTFFGANGQKKYIDVETYKRFTKRMKLSNHWRDKRAVFKSIARVSSIQNFQSSHKIIVNNKIITERGQELSINNLNKSKIKNGKRINTESAYLRLNHYWCRSEEEYYTLRNFRGNSGAKKKKKFSNWNKITNLLEDYKILDFLNRDQPPIVTVSKKDNPPLQRNRKNIKR